MGWHRVNKFFILLTGRCTCLFLPPFSDLVFVALWDLLRCVVPLTKIRLPMRVVETDYIRLELLDNGILIATYKRQSRLTLEMAREIVQTRLDFVGLEPRPVLVLNEGVVQIDKAARKWVGSGDGVAGIKASAVVADKPFTYFIISLILQVERPPMPVRVCRTKERAMTWLEGYL